MLKGASHGIRPVMEHQCTFHIVGSTGRSRSEQARAVFALGHHAEIYDDLPELIERRAIAGAILAGGKCSKPG